MKIRTGGQEYACSDYKPGLNTARFLLADAVPDGLGETVELLSDDGFMLTALTVSAWLRWYIEGKALVFTNVPTVEPGLVPEPEPTQLDRVEAQATYTAMMTDTLLEG